MERHPKGLYLLFTVEMWERFSYYGMRAILIFYLTKSYLDGGLGFDFRTANLIYGIFTGLVYFTPVIGGWIADRFWGQRLSIVVGALLMAAGEFTLAAGQSRTLLLMGLTLLMIGNGFFKPNISVIVGKLYSPTDHRRDAAFTIFYMGINVGALFSPLVCGTLAENYDYNVGFLAAGVGLLIGLAFYLLTQQRLLGDAGKRQAPPRSRPMPSLEQVRSLRKKQDDTTTDTHRPLTRVERDRTWVIVIVTCFAVFFFASFEQAGSSLNIFTDQFVDRSIGSFTIPAAWFQSINPIFIVLLAPLFSMLWQWLGSKGKDPSIPVKMSLGMIMIGVGFLFMVGAVLECDEDEDSMVKASMTWIVLTYLFNTLGELCLSPIGLSMVSTLAPVKYASLLMGIWLMSSFIANILAGFVAASVQQVGHLTIFAAIAIVCILCGCVLLSISRKLRLMMHQD